MECRRLHFLTAGKTNQFVSRSGNHCLPKAANSHGWIAGIRNSEQRRIHADALEDRFWRNAVAANGLTDGSNPTRKNTVA